MLFAQAWGGLKCLVELSCTVSHSALLVQRKKSIDFQAFTDKNPKRNVTSLP
jgi:hypothetical protein